MSSQPLFKYGEKMYYAEPSWYQGFKSPYFKPKHEAFRHKVRAFIDAEMNPFVDEWEEQHVTNPNGFEMPAKDIAKKAYKAGVLSPQWPTELGGTPPEGGWDAFMDLVWLDEIGRCASAGAANIFSIPTMALPMLLKFGNPALVKEVGGAVVRGEKFIALCISEPSAGSDVASIRTTAEKTTDGKGFVLNGQKKWITMGIFADYYVVAARTGPAGAKGLSVFLVPRTAKGLVARRMRLQGQWLAGTALIAFDNVYVPKENLLGEENKGFKQVVYNFNHERFLIAVQANRACRMLLTAAMGYAARRKTFGKTLLEHQVIRSKLFDMAMRIEANQALAENVAYQMDQNIEEALLGGTMAMLKVTVSRTLELCVRETSQIFGGASYVRSGVGARVERAGRELRASTIPGGSDEILADFALRQALQLTARARMQEADSKL